MDSGVSYLLDSGGTDALDARAPILVAASDERGHRRAAESIEAGGLRAIAIPIEAALDRLALQAAAGALWIEVDRDGGADLDRLLDQANIDAAEGRRPTIVAAPATLIDPIAARLVDEATHILIDPDPAERMAALAVATAWHRNEPTLHDISAEPSSARLRQLSDEVSRIAATLARLSSGVGATGPASAERPRPERGGERTELSGEVVRGVIRARRLRARYFDSELFADPAWDMLLDLLAAEIAQHRVPVSSLCVAAAVPPTTALRWIKTMTDNGLFVRRSDPHDGRRIFVELAPTASDAMHRYFAEVEPAVSV